MKNINIPLNYKERSNSKISFICSVVVLILLFLILNQTDYALFRGPAKEAARQEELARKKAEEEAAKPVVTSVDVIAAGNNLYHSSLMESGIYNAGWNYEHVYENIKPIISGADLAIVNQDTVLTADHDVISSYPKFATPVEVGDALVKAGFDVIQAATNNVDDFGYGLISQTMEFWRANYPDITLLGLHETQTDADNIKVREVNGIKIAFLNYTFGTNGEGAGAGKEFVIDLFDKEKISAAIKKAKSISDCIIFSAHWGPDNDSMPDEYQKQWAAFLLENGVDVLLGSHPYTLQPYGRLVNDSGHSMLVYYSLGNFVTGQESLDKLLGGLAQFTIQKTVFEGLTTIDIIAPDLKPIVAHSSYETGDYGPYLLEKYTDELAASHDVKEILGDEFSVANLNKRYKEIMSTNVKPSTGTDLLDKKPESGNSDDGSSDGEDYDDGSYDEYDENYDEYSDDGDEYYDEYSDYDDEYYDEYSDYDDEYYDEYSDDSEYYE